MLGALQALLAALLFVAAGTLLIAGLAQQRRARRLARQAHMTGMKFAPEDPFDMLRACAGFALIQCGHSPRANNLIDGCCQGMRVRAFDFRYEVGHGTMRLTRHYAVVVVQSPSPDVVLWNQADRDGAPLTARQADGSVGAWTYRGRPEVARVAARACGDLADAAVSIEAHEGQLLFCTPVVRGEAAPAGIVPAVAAARTLHETLDQPGDDPH